MALFGNPSTTGSSKNLVEFKAGKMTLREKTVTPDKRKGLVYIHQSDDSLMHFCWKDRTSGTVEDVSILNFYYSGKGGFKISNLQQQLQIKPHNPRP